MKAAFLKSSGRAIRSSMARFVSIMLISFLGAGVFAGLAAVSPDMKRTGDAYYDAQNVMDVRLLSAYGFSDDDVKAVKDTDGVSGVIAACTVDATGTVGDKDYVFRINGLPGSHEADDPDYINRLLLTDGRWPGTGEEAVIVRPALGLKNITLGCTVVLNRRSNAALSDTLSRMSYTVVGIADSPAYMSFVQGETSVGNGSIGFVLYVPQQDFTADGYTDLYVTVAGAQAVNAFEDGYLQSIDGTAKRLKALAVERQALRRDQFRSDLAKAEQQYEESRQEASAALAHAQVQLDSGAVTLSGAKKQYAEGLSTYMKQKVSVERQLFDGKVRLDSAASTIASGENALAERNNALNAGESQLKAARAKLDEGWEEYRAKAAELAGGEAALAKNKQALDSAQTQYDAGAASAEQATGLTMEQIEVALPSMRSKLAASKSQYETVLRLADLREARDAAVPGTPEHDAREKQFQDALQAAGLSEQQAAEQIVCLDAAKMQLDASQSQYDQLSGLVAAKKTLAQNQADYNSAVLKAEAGKDQLAAAKQTLDGSEADYSSESARLEAGKDQLASAENQLVLARQAYRQGLATYVKQRSDAEKMLADGRARLDGAAKKLTEGDRELARRRDELANWKVQTATKLTEADRAIEEAKAKLSDLGEPRWYVLDRTTNESFVSFDDDAGRMHDLATVFPVIFYLVAALVCLTTMTRMVDEDRTLIGTFEALGYSNGRIAGRYLSYAALASIIGSMGGVLVGFRLLPAIVWNAYGIVFTLPAMTPAFYPGIAAVSVFSTVLTILISTGIAARRSLLESPAELMRPRAPKSGQRVLLEYLRPIWSRLTFTRKVTVRNLGLNRKRVAVTLAGIMGCTSLVVTALGARNAVNTIVDQQLGSVLHYDVAIGFNGTHPSAGLASRLSDPSRFEKSVEVLWKTGEVGLDDDKSKTYSVHVVSPCAADKLSDFITLADPSTGKPVSFADTSAVITQKLSMNLHVGVGDVIAVSWLDDEKPHHVTITGITTNYAFNFVYLGRKAYEQAFGKMLDYNQFLAITTAGCTDDQIRSFCSTAPGVGAISFTSDLLGNLRTSTRSVDKIVWILIIAAGLLAFTVLYNLTNINISERQRELATLKVLGFYDRETYDYIFRETIILSVIGCLLGLAGGIFVYRAVIVTVEPEMILLPRNLAWVDYAGSAVLTMFFTWIVNQCLKPRIYNIDMLGSLKSVE